MKYSKKLLNLKRRQKAHDKLIATSRSIKVNDRSFHRPGSVNKS
jgi:hypothetical protein